MILQSLQTPQPVTHKESSIAKDSVSFWALLYTYTLLLFFAAKKSMLSCCLPRCAITQSTLRVQPQGVSVLCQQHICRCTHTDISGISVGTKTFYLAISMHTTGVVEESQKWVCPVQSNQPLKEAFLAYANPPNSHQKLRTLSQYVSLCKKAQCSLT